LEYLMVAELFQTPSRSLQFRQLVTSGSKHHSFNWTVWPLAHAYPQFNRLLKLL